jgi:hypothetical protein
MRAVLTCTNCKRTDEFDKSEIENIGTFATQLWGVQCHDCGEIIATESQSSTFPKNKELLLEYDAENDGVVIARRSDEIKFNPEGNAYERAEKGKIKEYWIQEFFKEHFKDYGFERITGPFDTGPDFLTDGNVGIEIERDWKSYINHGHPTNKNFSNVKYLVVLSPDEPKSKSLKSLPEQIIYINIDDFVPWFRMKCKEFKDNKEADLEELQPILRFELIKGEFLKRYLSVCPDQERELANCPFCKGCAFEPEDVTSWTLEFIIRNGYYINDSDFSFGDIDPIKLNQFFTQRMQRP